MILLLDMTDGAYQITSAFLDNNRVTASKLCQGLHVVRSYGASLETFDACADVSDYVNLHIEGQQDN